jgi:endoglucanase
LTNQASNAFGTVIGGSQREFVWGSNSIAANQGVLLIYAYKISKDKKYTDAALSNLDYLLGRNATNYCFVTGIGTKSPMHPHHRPSVSDNIVEPVPGMLEDLTPASRIIVLILSKSRKLRMSILIARTPLTR